MAGMSRPRSGEEDGLRSTIANLDKQVDKYENEELLRLARGEIPLDELKAVAEALQESDTSLCYEGLKRFSRFEVSSEVSYIRCPRGSFGQVVQADLFQMDWCVHLLKAEEKCLVTKRRPYTMFEIDPRYLMRSRVGRCGEFANLFALFIRAVGLRGRYVWNAEDHVWNEYYSPALKRWVHMDSCENARDQHLLYDVGWGKKQSYILAFSTEGAQDVSRAYIKDYGAALSRRNRMNEDDLQSVLAEVTRKRRAKLERKRLAELEQEDEWQAKFLRGEPSSASQEKEAEADLGPRQSGTAEWKAARGEDGKHD
ncbi:peptide-N4-(N-acetyl-beta- glucosaminyl)asparagine amidase [Serendipita sp. 399]|nr:peptide-N4-(N-acetyl-beta- glucosaminyl)asparagine amidase [Serendipita sp. 399]